MAIQTATTGNLENAQNIMITTSRYTAEHNAPCIHLIERFTLPKGHKQITVPKVAQMTASALTDGVDIIDAKDIGMTTTDLTTAEVGLKVILTYKLINQENEDVFRMVGRQMGDAMARKKDEDIIALFSALNGGTTLGADNANLTLAMYSACVARATADKYPKPVFVVHHPNALADLAKSAMNLGTPASTYRNSGGLSEHAAGVLKNFYSLMVNGVEAFHDGNINKIAATGSGYGAIFSKNSMAYIEGWGDKVEREQDISLRAWEVVITSDYGVFELDDGYGAPMRYEIGNLNTTAT